MKQSLKKLVVCCIVILISGQVHPVYAGWISQEINSGQYRWWYSTSLDNRSWLYGNPVIWQWLDGNGDGIAECYAFDQEGWMLADTVTPDGYYVNGDGAWVVDGVVQTKTLPVQSSKKSSGGGGGSSSGQKSTSSGTLEDTGTEAEPEEQPELDKTELVTYSYTIWYQDIATGQILGQVTGSAEKNREIKIKQPQFQQYMICAGQPDSVTVTYDDFHEFIYYKQIPEASPSNAEEISWQLRFVDAETNQNQLLPMRSGTIVDGGTLVINYMERITVGTTIWQAVEQPPFQIQVFGPGHQLYYVQFIPVGEVSEQPDPDAPAKAQLLNYLELAKEYESQLTGEEPQTIPDSRIIVGDKTGNDARIGSIASQISDFDNHVFYVIGKNYKPNGILITEWFGQDRDGEYSSVTEAVLSIGEDSYTVVRMSVTLLPDEETCAHIWEIKGENPADCIHRGNRNYQCSQCKKEMEVKLPALGHVDVDGDSYCDRCLGPVGEAVGGQHWKLGDIQAQELDGQTYFFACIDPNYSDEGENHRQTALFLCTEIIPANYGSGYQYEQQSDGTYDYVFYPGEIVNFGSGNDYKYSNIRKFLQRLEQDAIHLADTNIGVSYAYQGLTGTGTYEQFRESDLSAYYIGSQKMVDQLFILSMDEALKYREFLWNINETGPYSKGYWLRSPMGDSKSHDTDYAYIVDLINGNIRPERLRPSVETEHDDEIRLTGTVGVRPAYTMQQN